MSYGATRRSVIRVLLIRPSSGVMCGVVAGRTMGLFFGFGLGSSVATGVIAAAWVAARPLALAPIARLFGKVSGR